MTVAQLLVWAGVIPQLINAGIAVEGQIVSLIKSFHPGMTDAELNAVAQLLIDSATTHLAVAKKDAGII